MEFARSLPQPDIYNAISQAEPLGPISQYARTENLRRRYDQARALYCHCDAGHQASAEQGHDSLDWILPGAIAGDTAYDASTWTTQEIMSTCNILRTMPMQVDMPDGLCILGDACASFNPTYGQGMTVGIRGAVLMRDMLRKRLGNAKFGAGKGPAALQGFTQVNRRVAALGPC